ncbi:MAG: peptide ABC transporter substrate-binding protein [Bdellovibrionia bacterium]
MDRKITLAVLSLISVLIFGGCNRPLPTGLLGVSESNISVKSAGSSVYLFPNSPSSAPDSLRVQLPTEPISLDPSLALDGVSLQVLNNIDEGLMGYSSEGRLDTRLAESYELSRDGKKYIFTLRKGALWSDGQALVVQDFVTAFRRTLSAKTLSRMAPIYFNIRNAKAFHEGKINEKDLAVNEVNGKLVIELEKKVPSFLHSLTLPQTFPLRKEILDAHGGSWPESGPVSGPYRIASHKFEQSIVLERNPHYRNSSSTRPQSMISRIEYKITDESTAINLFDQGMLDIVTRVSALDLPRLQSSGRVKLSPFLATYYLSFNCRKAPFNNKVFRRAVAGSIRRAELVQVLGGGELPAWSWIPKGLEGYMSYKDPSVVFAGAIHELTQRREQSAPIEASFDISARNSRIMEKIQQDLLKDLNVNLSLTPLSWQAFNHSIKSDPPPLFRYGWMAPFMDPITHLRVFTTGNLNNFSGCSNLNYDALVEEIETLPPGPTRETKIFAAQKILLEEEAAVVPIYHYVQHTAVSPRVKEFKINAFGIIKFQDLSL